MPQGPESLNYQNYHDHLPQGNRPKSNWLWLVILAVVVVLGVGIYYYFLRPGSSAYNQNQTQGLPGTKAGNSP